MESKIQTKTLAEQGPQLPLGIQGPSGISRDIAVRKWRMKEEKELGELRDKDRSANLAQYVSMVLGTMCTKLGPHNFETMKPEERRAIVAQMYMADVFYAYIWLRIQALGADLALKIQCRACRQSSELSADLNTVEVKVCDTPEDAVWKYALKDPITVRGQEVKQFQLGPARWTAVESVPAGTGMNANAAKGAIIQGSVMGFDDGKPVVLGSEELDELSKLDLEKLTVLIDDKAVGPMMILEEECPKCKTAMRMPLDWNYDSFFGSSAR